MTTFIHTGRSAPFLTRLLARVRASAEQARLRRIEQKGLREMLALDDDLLRDIGVTRGDVAYAANLPGSRDRAAELRKLSKRGNRW